MRDATSLAESVRVLVDQPAAVALEIVGDERSELALLNAHGKRLEFSLADGTSVVTDSKAAYIAGSASAKQRILACRATELAVAGNSLVQSEERIDWEQSSDLK